MSGPRPRGRLPAIPEAVVGREPQGARSPVDNLSGREDMPPPRIELGLRVPETLVMSFSLRGRA
jgi:hypothetical protein